MGGGAMGFSDAQLYDKIRAANPNASPAAWQKMLEECKAACLNDVQKQIDQQYGNKYPSYGQQAIQDNYNNALTGILESTSQGISGYGFGVGPYATNGLPDPSQQAITFVNVKAAYEKLEREKAENEYRQRMLDQIEPQRFMYWNSGMIPFYPMRYQTVSFQFEDANPVPVAPAKPKELAVVPTGKRTILFDEEI